MTAPYDRQFVCCLYWLGLDHWSLGLHVHWLSPNIEVHLPFCFFRFGWQGTYRWSRHTFTLGKQYRP